jgi:hypothetical protein
MFDRSVFISIRLLKKGRICFDKLSMNGIISIISSSSRFVLSRVEGLRGSFSATYETSSGDEPSYRLGVAFWVIGSAGC